MPVFVVANPKGGVGKSTLASNLAGYLARQGHRVALGDVDVQQSSRQWLSRRPAGLPQIHALEVDGKQVARPPKGVSHVVLDTPAGLHGKRLELVMGLADKVLVPLQASLFDMQATFDFLQRLDGLSTGKRAAPGVAVLGMRVKEGTLSVAQLQQFVAGLKAVSLGHLRDTQNYVQLAAHGLSLWDVAPGRVERDLQQWQSVVEWVAS